MQEVEEICCLGVPHSLSRSLDDVHDRHVSSEVEGQSSQRVYPEALSDQYHDGTSGMTHAEEGGQDRGRAFQLPGEIVRGRGLTSRHGIERWSWFGRREGNPGIHGEERVFSGQQVGLIS